MDPVVFEIVWRQDSQDWQILSNRLLGGCPRYPNLEHALSYARFTCSGYQGLIRVCDCDGSVKEIAIEKEGFSGPGS